MTLLTAIPALLCCISACIAISCPTGAVKQALASLQLAPLQPQQHRATPHVPSDKNRDTWRLLRLRRSLGASGFHRVLHLEVALEHTDGGRSTPLAPPGETAPDAHAQKGSEDVKAEPTLGPAAAVAKACKMAVVQLLPAAVYADVDELAALQAAGAPFQAELFGVRDAERTEAECCPTALLLILEASSPLTAASESDTTARCVEHDGSCSVSGDSSVVSLNASVPVHARYPRPILGRSPPGSSASFWHSLISPTATIELEFPIVAIRCDPDVAWDLLFPASTVSNPDTGHDKKVITLMVPAGSLLHVPLVQYCTAALYVIAAAVIVFASTR
eukprot:CAMPEP_0206145496 /NCGR_PEP_ID=MMETSP1473-20131121/27545_1 /ASSEMBLY_ACC=CAM_ASM_001109 /TAXON_ID=1461547 /ORGANISM="Stichococcus sp, Strain RCC1054" /LENGTH=331 /DNA_ID=CAMNT_0053541739 /DNA_START=418 /DNA_END=1413 /DNA_ORIENTATION=+